MVRRVNAGGSAWLSARSKIRFSEKRPLLARVAARLAGAPWAVLIAERIHETRSVTRIGGARRGRRLHGADTDRIACDGQRAALPAIDHGATHRRAKAVGRGNHEGLKRRLGRPLQSAAAQP